MAESTRPKTMKKNRGDVTDIEAILEWLAKHDLCINFTGYPEKPEELICGVRKLYQINVAIRPLLETTMEPQDFSRISD